MFDAPIDAWYVWFGLAVTSLAVLGVALSLPSTPPPDATGVAETVDRVGAAGYGASAERPLSATAVRLDARGVDLRNDAGESHATFARPVVPVTGATRLVDVLDGHPPSDVFESPRAFQQAVIEARSREPAWRPVEGSLVVRHVSWEGVDATLVRA